MGAIDSSAPVPSGGFVVHELDIEIFHFDAGNGQQVEELGKLSPHIDDLLRDLYGAAYRGIDHFYTRVSTRKSQVWVARTRDGQVVGLTYVRPSGKRDGTGVRTSLRRCGLAKKLLLTSLSLIPRQFAAPLHENAPMVRLYRTNGFTFLKRVEQLHKLLEPAEFADTANHRIVDGILEFDRFNRYINTMEFGFICMVNYAEELE